jgi:NAD(P)-dependent dehydrogenase (short-subunit alcohol dehydrogenase family)
MTLSLTGKTALVTGASRGIGAAIAERLLVDGANVHVSATQPDGSGPEGTTYVAVDFIDPIATEAFSKYARDLAPDILINNVGINKIAPFADIDPTDFEHIHQVNVLAPFRVCQAVVPQMRAKGWGRIVNISSIWGKISKAQRASYSASKFALDGMTTALAAEIAADGVLANCVAPGIIDTELTRNVLGEAGIANLTAQIPAGRLGKAEEVASFVTWLAGPENTYISGQNIAIDGGFTRV